MFFLFFFLIFLLEGVVLTAVLSEEEIVLSESHREGGHHAQSLIITFTDRDHQKKFNIYHHRAAANTFWLEEYAHIPIMVILKNIYLER